jgi:hypothetical protein
MPQPLSDALGVSADALTAAGVFDGFVDLDSRLHIDPHLLAHCATPEMYGAREVFDEHFANVFKLIRASKKRHDIFWQKAAENLVFTEIPNTGLGYARQGKAGSAIGCDVPPS